MRKLMIVAFSSCLSMSAGAEQGLDAASQEALEKTQNLLKTFTIREEALKENSKVRAADGVVDRLTGGNTKAKEEIYNLASDVFAELVKETRGDARKMQEVLDHLKRDPAAFANRWTPEQRARLKMLADQLTPSASPGR